MIKGTTTIQLFDSKTGKKEKEYQENNIVTDVIENLVNQPGWTWFYGNSYSVPWLIRNNSNIHTFLTRGILLYKNYHGEKSSKIFPDASNELIGCAGANTKTNEKDYFNLQGVLNSELSISLENGQRYVWDFSQEKANGTIKSVSLTNQYSGEYGAGSFQHPGVGAYYHFLYADYYGIKYPYGKDLQTSISDEDLDGGIVFYIKPLENGNIEMLYFSAGYNGDKDISYYSGDRCIYKLTYQNQKIFNLLKNDDTKLLKKEKISNPIHNANIYNWSIWVDNEKLINITYTTERGSTYTKITTAFHKIYSLSGKLISENEVNLSKVSFEQGAIGYLDGKYYAAARLMNGPNIYCFSQDGETIYFNYSISPYGNSATSTIFIRVNYATFTINQYTGEPYFTFTRIDNIGESSNKARTTRFYISKVVNNTMYIQNQMHTEANSYYVGNIYLDAVHKMIFPYVDGDTGIKLPYIPISATQKYGSKNAMVIFRPLCCYLATINDLDEPVTKKPTQTMRVTYELIEDGG